MKSFKHKCSGVYNSFSPFNFLELDEDHVIDATHVGTEAKFMNHSCDPNCRIEKWFECSLLILGKLMANIELGCSH
jgi:hypothetical protein